MKVSSYFVAKRNFWDLFAKTFLIFGPELFFGTYFRKIISLFGLISRPIFEKSIEIFCYLLTIYLFRYERPGKAAE